MQQQQQQLTMIQFYGQHYPFLKPQLQQVTDLIENFLKRDVTEELELRIGSLVNGRFFNGVSLDFFERTLQLLEEFEGFSVRDDDWVQTVDYFYNYRGQTLRSRVSEKGLVETIVKSVKERHDIEISVDRDLGLQKLLPGAIRIQAAKENVYFLGANDDLGMNLTLLRLKQRKQFVYKEWRFELSKVWTGTTFQEADRAFFTKDPAIYEIEIEFIGSSLKTPVQLAVSLLLKVLDFFPESVNLM